MSLNLWSRFLINYKRFTSPPDYFSVALCTLSKLQSLYSLGQWFSNWSVHQYLESFRQIAGVCPQHL